MALIVVNIAPQLRQRRSATRLAADADAGSRYRLMRVSIVDRRDVWRAQQ
jgi:hypothetical protein